MCPIRQPRREGIPIQRTQFSTRTTHFQTKATPEIISILLDLKNRGKSDYTIKNVDKLLSLLARDTDLHNPETVLQNIANRTVSTATKQAFCYAYKMYCKQYQINAKIPYYQAASKPIKIPTKEKLEMFIANASPTLAIQLTASMETGLRPIELMNLRVKDIDLEQRNIYPTTAKHGAARTLKISNNLAAMLQTYIIRNNMKPETKLFRGNANNYGKNFRSMRSHLAKKLQDATLLNVRLYDFRHYFATTTYNKTKDVLYVKQQMGHKRIETTLIYTQLINFGEEEYTSKAVKTPEEVMKLVDAGFQYVQTVDGLHIYKKRK